MSLLAGLVLTMVFLMTGLVEQFNREPFDAVAAIGAETWLVADGVSGPFTSVSAIPVSAVSEFGPGAAPVVVSRGSLFVSGSADNIETVVIGHRLGDLGAPPVIAGEAATSNDQVVIDSSAGVGVGDTVQIGSKSFTVSGLTEHATVLAGLPFAFMGIESAQDLTYGNRETISAVLSPDVGASGSYTVRSADEVAEDALGPLESAIGSLDLIRGLLWIVATIIIGAVVYLSALERTRDFAVLKAVGASNRELSVGLLVQAVIVALVAALAATVLQSFVAPVFPLPVRVPLRAYWQVPLLAAVVSMISAVAGMRRVVGADPSDALAGAA